MPDFAKDLGLDQFAGFDMAAAFPNIGVHQPNMQGGGGDGQGSDSGSDWPTAPQGEQPPCPRHGYGHGHAHGNSRTHGPGHGKGGGVQGEQGTHAGGGGGGGGAPAPHVRSIGKGDRYIKLALANHGDGDGDGEAAYYPGGSAGLGNPGAGELEPGSRKKRKKAAKPQASGGTGAGGRVPAPRKRKTPAAKPAKGASDGHPPKQRSTKQNCDFSYSQLCIDAIMAQPEKRLQVTDIYDWIEANCPRFTPGGEGCPVYWKNSVRHTLSTKKHFAKVAIDKTNAKSPCTKSVWVLTNSTGGGAHVPKPRAKVSAAAPKASRAALDPPPPPVPDGAKVQHSSKGRIQKKKVF